jgi:hypothetical protein
MPLRLPRILPLVSFLIVAPAMIAYANNPLKKLEKNPLKATTNSVKVKTDKGEVEGSYTADNQVLAFKGIPYAAPPVGDLRWQPPQPAARAKIA